MRAVVRHTELEVVQLARVIRRALEAVKRLELRAENCKAERKRNIGV
jgi:hypothetical protein